MQDYVKATGVGINAVHYLTSTAVDIFDVGPFGSRSIVAASKKASSFLTVVEHDEHSIQSMFKYLSFFD